MAEQAAAQFNSQRAATAATEDEGEQDPLTGVCVCVCDCVCVFVICVEEDEDKQDAFTGVCECVCVLCVSRRMRGNRMPSLVCVPVCPCACVIPFTVVY